MCFRPPVAAKPKICPSCGMINPVIAKKCIKCKETLPEDKIACPQCGELNDAGAQECAFCGFSGDTTW